jgi:2-(1,2-epoxy-1,2-dihydrophenyl)acetyl-CoA isomerase
MSNRQPLVTGTEDLLGWVEEGVAVLSFNRPEARNALSASMYEGFATALPQVVERSDIGCLVLTGEGGAFCAGGDVKGFAARNAAASSGPRLVESAVDDLRRRQREVSLTLHQLPKTTIAAIPGAAAGAGLSIALSCDLRIAAARSVITTAFSKIGASGDFGGSWFLTQLVGPSRAKELYLLSERLSATQAHELGIVNMVAADDEFEATWTAVARRIAAGPTLAYRYIKENVNRAAAGADLATCLDAEAPAMVKTMSSADHREAAAAFVEKRTPTFHGS